VGKTLSPNSSIDRITITVQRVNVVWELDIIMKQNENKQICRIYCNLQFLACAGIKVSRNAPERHSWAGKFKPGAFRLQNYWI